MNVFLMVMGVVLSMALASPVYAQSIQYRDPATFGVGLERSTDGGLTWEGIHHSPSVQWLIWAEEAPQHVCFLFVSTTFFGGTGASPRVYCSWDAGDTWYFVKPTNEPPPQHPGFVSTRPYPEAFALMPTYVNRLEVARSGDGSLILTAYDSVFRLSRAGDRPIGPHGLLQVEKIGERPRPASCNGIPALQICAALALDDVPAVWYDPEQSGQGLTLVGLGGTFWGYYTTYDEFGDAHWYLFQFARTLDPETATFNGESRQIMENAYRFDLLQFTGPPLGADWIPEQVQGISISQAQLKFIPPNQLIFRPNLTEEDRPLNMVPFE